MQRVYNQLRCRLDRAEAQFISLVDRYPRSRLARWMIAEGLVSQTWQAWGHFCRQLIMLSALGCVSRGGVSINPCVAPATTQRVSYLSIWATGTRSPTSIPNATRTNTVLRREPTWGNVSSLVDIVQVINPANRQIIEPVFGAVTGGPLDLQKVRNASAHYNAETAADILSLASSYVANGRPLHPTDALFWTDPKSSDYAFSSWIDDLRLISDLVTQ